MYSSIGTPRPFSDAQLKILRTWYRRRCALQVRRAQHPTLASLARELGVSLKTVTAVIRRGRDFQPARGRVGRPLKLRSAEVIAQIFAWHDEHVALRKLRRRIGTNRGIAARLGVKVTVIQYAVGCQLQYKAAPPELRDEVRMQRRALMRQLVSRAL